MNDDTRGTYYFQPERPQPADLLSNPPFRVGTAYEPSCGTGSFLTQAAEEVQK
jgi:hypothetical protein